MILFVCLSNLLNLIYENKKLNIFILKIYLHIEYLIRIKMFGIYIS